MFSSSKPLKTNQQPQTETFAEALQAVIVGEFGTQKALAIRLNITEPNITNYKNGSKKMTQGTLAKLLAQIESPVLRARLHTAWAGQTAPQPTLSAGTPVEQVGLEVESLFQAGFAEQAIALARAELKRSPAFPRWFAIAERLEPLYIRVGRLAKAAALRAEIERRALAAHDPQAFIAALAMRENILQSIDAATPAVVEQAHRQTELAAEQWRPKEPGERRLRELRLRNMKRVRANQAVSFVAKHRLSPLHLADAMADVEASFEPGDPDYMIATGLEMRARVQAAHGELNRAEHTIEDLEAFGADRGWDVWEKSRLTLARIFESQGKKERAIEILHELRTRCHMSGNGHYERAAEQELARLILGI